MCVCFGLWGWKRRVNCKGMGGGGMSLQSSEVKIFRNQRCVTRVSVASRLPILFVCMRVLLGIVGLSCFFVVVLLFCSTAVLIVFVPRALLLVLHPAWRV